MKNFSMFEFQSDLHVGDPKFEVLEGTVRVSTAILTQDVFFREHMDYGFDFFGVYNLRTKNVNVVTTYYPEDGDGFGEVVNLPLTQYEKSELVDSMEAFCKETYKVGCLEFLNWHREAVGFGTLEGNMVGYAREQIEEEVGCRLEEKIQEADGRRRKLLASDEVRSIREEDMCR